ncbi:MAG: ribonuclease HI [Gammaproteobacteria bacterium]|nr:ribonuclease HI [Gammaproteobacteria bacterium]MDE1887732.1 ribonuclease HI [Gammaproteobacteria bacterium]MDE2023668.1 ribonuclease HI [Gammaproteobacteria bacterium]MDE2139504.1 ribonuclease HI [Gammaproteobacteria bacterium]MDE2273128.1 ribonuclease HI [Gammaproteobacteria bacterium]
MDSVEIYTDGACRGNPGPGGWAAVLRSGAHEKILRGSAAQTTNNRMELTAAVSALQALTRPASVVLYTDSKYVQQGISEWLPAWRARGWKTAGRKPVKNLDLWQALHQATAGHAIEWRWVRGHSGNAYNEEVDRLANEAIDKMLSVAGNV